MQVKNINVQEFLNRLRLYVQENDITRKYAKEAPPLRAELYTTEQLDAHGRHLAGAHVAKVLKSKERLLKRLAKNDKILLEVYTLLSEAIRKKQLVSPAGEWLLDNYYLIEEHIRTGKKHLPKGYSEGLPRLMNTPSAGLPRVYDIALELISHTDGRIDLEGLITFIHAYQQVSPLKIGELWAIPIMLRLALIENLRRVAVRVAIGRINQGMADHWASLMVEASEKDPKNLILVIADMARSAPPMESSFVAEMIRQLMWKGPALALPLTWIEQRLAEINLTSNELVNRENQKQAADQVSISNSIGSLRFLGAVEWHEFVEKMSVVEHTLRRDASGIYPGMDFATRDRYRHCVEKVAKHSKLSENDVALSVVQLAQNNSGKEGIDQRKGHVGYYLVDDGQAELGRMVKQQLPVADAIRLYIKRFPVLFYVGSILLFSALISFYLLKNGYTHGANKWLLLFTGILAFMSVSHMVTSVINWLATCYINPDPLPRLDFSEGIPVTCKTLVVVPTMLNNKPQIEHLAESLEVRFLANRCPNLHFALLTDLPDAHEMVMPQDEEYVELARKKIEELNQKYAGSGTEFYLFHRPRKWNAYDKIWMGYERKRGKLSEINKLLRGEGRDNFSVIEGNIDVLDGTRYVITLDTDTQLPRDTAWRLVGTMAHPLNKAWYDETKHRITKGYGILQPRVSVSIPRKGYSIYGQIHGNEPGIDPYTKLSSDLYQDMFHEGSFIGKGIYDIDAFEAALADQLPENRILSHDLLEGCYTRSGLLSDIQLYEEYPSHYSSDVNRRHRWIRGDWQVGYWALPFAPNGKNKLRRNKLSMLSKWKIFDNLRRSLVPLCLTFLLLVGWSVMHAAWFWTVSVLIIVMLPSVLVSAWNMFRKSREITLKQHISISINAITDNFFRDAFIFICLPYEAYYSADAIVRTSWRMLFSHKKLLEWVPSGNQEHTSDKTLAAAYRSMWISPFIAAVAFIYFVIFAPVKLIAVMPVLVLWGLSPFIAWKISKPFKKREAELNNEQRTFLEKLTRRTWAFFEVFVSKEDNWLPPDNYQESPNNAIAHRTSPTNIGMALLSNLAAYDFGYVTINNLLTRLANTFDTLSRMERYRGHLYNWYDTTTLQPLYPKYVSTVDSGNMAGHLLTLKQGLLNIPFEPVLSHKLPEGLLHTLYVLQDEIPGNEQVAQARLKLTAWIQGTDSSANALTACLHDLVLYAEALIADCEQLQNTEAAWWANKFRAQCGDMLLEINTYKLVELTALIPQNSETLRARLQNPTLRTLATLQDDIDGLYTSSLSPEEKEQVDQLREISAPVIAYAKKQMAALDTLAQKCTDFADLDFEFLYDRSKNLLAIGYNTEEHVRDTGFYDLLASEARLTNFVAIAQGNLPQESWFSLSRSLTDAGGTPMLVSWSGSMFEYLMPLLVMPAYEGTLLDQTHKASVARQIAYGAERDVPWGISESCYNMLDANLNYQYRAFGVPKLGLKRGLADDLVIAPYASVLALMVAPEAAYANIEQLHRKKFSGRYGLYEAVDYTASRLPRGQQYAVIKSYMAHHQGMSLLSLSYLLHNQPMQRRFEAELQFQATLLLLQERVPKATTIYAHEEDADPVAIPVAASAEIRIIDTPHTPVPEIQLLSNGRYHVMVTNSGGGYSRWKGLAVTRWREDTTRDNWGTFCYVRNVGTGAYWSNTYQPTLTKPDHYEAIFSQGRAEFRRRDDGIETYTEVVVSPEDDIEMRRVHVINRSAVRKEIEVTSYAEVVINTQATDAIHPAFSNLFVQTEIVEHKHAIIATRRPRSASEQPPWMMHLLIAHGTEISEISYETDRAKFIGRGRTTVDPVAMTGPGALSNTQGAVLDPVVAIRYRFFIEPGASVVLDMITGIGHSNEECHALIEKYQDIHHKDRVFELAWTHSQIVLRQINASEADAQLYARLAGSVMFANPMLRADASVISLNERGQSGLWGFSVSGDLPIVLLQLENKANIDLAKQLVQAHAYWRLKGFATDLVIWNEDNGGYRQDLQNQVLGLVAAGTGSELTDYPGGIYVRASDQVANEDRILFQAVARICLSDKKGSLTDQLEQIKIVKEEQVLQVISKPHVPAATPLEQPQDLLLFNGIGGFSADGKEYVIITGAEHRTPAPWINVLANPSFGSIISESGQSYTWAENAHEFRLTPWENDPVSDKGGEVFYIRNEHTGHFWSPTALPATGISNYITRHGFGYSIFEHSEGGIFSSMQVFVDVADPVKFFVLKLRNQSGEKASLSVTCYMEWVLGDMRSKTGMHIVTEVNTETGALIARNSYNKEFDKRICFFDTDDPGKNFTCDRAAFIGRNGTLAKPLAMKHKTLSGSAGAGIDPCAALQVSITLHPGEEQELIFRLGVGSSMDDAIALVRRCKGQDAAIKALQLVKDYWHHTLTAVQINTPSQPLNILANGWLIYQTIVCRLWARSGYYQSGGAFGFRDQLQDVLAVLHARPGLARDQLLLCASRQFTDGDVQHWWHPPLGRGVRTQCSDDMLWLPYVAAKYLLHTGDKEILNEQVAFIDGRELNAGEESYYDLPLQSATSVSLYEHCKAAIKHCMRYGDHGLPFIGSGDWNDGMDLVGRHGKGESVWLAFFLYQVLSRFAEIALMQGDETFVATCKEHAATLSANIEKNAWDGNWYRRAYFDDGTPLGSSANDECSIDSISQSWAVLSGAVDSGRARIALTEADKRLVRPESMLIQLLDPPFDKSALDPGYIKGYVPGIRENGGQYTHAAVWMIMAHARLGNAQRAWELMDMINPLNHADTAARMQVYKVEPYVVAADVYSIKQNSGRGGWTWYTGSAGWMYQLITESLLGIRREGDLLAFTPCIPPQWPSCTVTYRYEETCYNITLIADKTDHPIQVELDGKTLPGATITLRNDKAEHNVVVHF